MNPQDYPFEIRPLSEEDGGGYLITFPDLPGCISDGDTPEAAIQNGFDAVVSWLGTAYEFGDHIPPPESSKSNGKNGLRLPGNLHNQLVTQARREGVSANTLAATYLAEGLERSLARQSDPQP